MSAKTHINSWAAIAGICTVTLALTLAVMLALFTNTGRAEQISARQAQDKRMAGPASSPKTPRDTLVVTTCFASAVSYTFGVLPQSIAFGDFNRDSRIDLVTSNS